MVLNDFEAISSAIDKEGVSTSLGIHYWAGIAISQQTNLAPIEEVMGIGRFPLFNALQIGYNIFEWEFNREQDKVC
jgi:hypothetical protein